MKKLAIVTILIFMGSNLIAQNNKKPLTFDDILKWNRITEKIISSDGNIIVYKKEPWKGDPVLKISDKSGKEIESINCGTDAVFTNNSSHVIFKLMPEEKKIRQLKLKETKEENLPLNQLGIYNLQKAMLDTIPYLKTHKVPKKWNGWIAYQTKSKEEKDSTNKKNDEKIKEESDENGYLLNIKDIETGNVVQYPYVTEYIFAKEKEIIAFVSTGDNEKFESGVYYFDLKTQKQIKILTGNGDYKQLSINKSGSMIAIIADTTENKYKNYSLYQWTGDNSTKLIVNNDDNNLAKDWKISPNGTIFFSESNNRIFFGTSPIKQAKDTTILDEEIPQLDVWHWNEPVLHTQQINTKTEDIKKAYLAVYHIESDKMIQLETPAYTGISLINQGDSDNVLAWTNLPYAVQIMWEGDPEHNDFYLININTGKATLTKKDCRAVPQVSPMGNYLYWYNTIDTSWNTYNITSGIEYKNTNPKLIQCAYELNDIPNPPEAYGIAGWLKNDEAFLIYDRFDIWKINPENKYSPINLTINGKQKMINYQVIDLENINRKFAGDNEIGINPSKPIYLKGHNEITRNDGYYKMSNLSANIPNELLSGRFKLNTPIKARNADVFVYTKENFELFPDLLISENDFKKSKIISNANQQQKEFSWGTAELYSWTSLDGRKLDGLLIKPANFDPKKKYPLIVNFYEKGSQGLYKYRTPEAHRSTIDYHYYSSNDYIIFNPDVYYKEGYPGEDAFNCVMPGVTQLISEGYIDKDHIAAQGHSWGGYQVAYLATRTNLFAAIESGAPVVNMFSAYGGIRLWSGRNRSFQYEHTQSRIGKSIWESPLRYLENSPLFTADKIQTPMLIMHNEDDGAVPFSQGIEFFIALRRLGKQAWLLNYNDADHWPTKVRDKYDFQIRLAQYFNHFLKGEPMPIWMKEGIPAINKGTNMGYELIE